MNKAYAYHLPSPQGLKDVKELREAFSLVDKLIQEICIPSREREIAIQKNEETAMWAIKAVVFNDPNSQVG